MTFGVSSLGFLPEKIVLHPFSKSTKHPSRSQYTFGAAAMVDFPALTIVAALPEPLTKGAACGLSAMVIWMKGRALAHRYIERVCRELVSAVLLPEEFRVVKPPAFIFRVGGTRCCGGRLWKRGDLSLAATPCLEKIIAMAPGKRKATSSPGSHPREAPRSPRFMPCPTCGKSFLARSLQQHAWTCAEAGPEAPPSDDNDTDVSGKGSSVNCPVCSRPFPQHAIESHAWGCMPPTDDLEVAAAPKRSPIGAGRGKRAIPANKEQSPARITDTRRASPSLPSRGSEIDLVSTASAASSTPEVPSSNMTVSRSGDVMQARFSRVSH